MSSSATGDAANLGTLNKCKKIDPNFDRTILIRNKLDKKLLLSMGMSGDYIKALERGSNMIRVGSKIFS